MIDCTQKLALIRSHLVNFSCAEFAALEFQLDMGKFNLRIVCVNILKSVAITNWIWLIKIENTIL